MTQDKKNTTPEFLYDLSWEEKAKINPLSAVMSVEQFGAKDADPANWNEEDRAAFFAKGRLIWECYYKPIVLRMGLKPGQAKIVEYGSGMGRVLRSVSEDGFDCAGIDISPSMLDHSRKLVPHVTDLNPLDANGRCQVPSESADFVYSHAVIQHIRELSKVQVAMEEIVRILKPGGVLRMQVRLVDLPFNGFEVFGRKYVRVINTESSTVQVAMVKRRLRGILPTWFPATPSVTKVRHDNWRGVRLGFRTLERLLNKAGARVIGVDQDVESENMVIVLARKGGKAA